MLFNLGFLENTKKNVEFRTKERNIFYFNRVYVYKQKLLTKKLINFLVIIRKTWVSKPLNYFIFRA